jgi:hypothetical protein
MVSRLLAGIRTSENALTRAIAKAKNNLPAAQAKLLQLQNQPIAPVSIPAGGHVIHTELTAPPSRIASAFASIENASFPYVMPATAGRPAAADDDGSSLGLGYAPRKAAAKPQAAPAIERDWIGWANVTGSGDHMGANTGDLSGNQVNVTAGLTHILTRDLLIGIVTGYEHSSYTVAALNARIGGDGGTIGGYAGWRITPTLRADLTAAWSDIAYDGTSGTASGSFNGHRWLVSGGLTGSYGLGGGYVLQPSARLFSIWERQDGYVDSLGSNQAANSFSVARASTGGDFSRPIFGYYGTVTPSVGLFADYRFSSSNATPFGMPMMVSIKDGFTARLTSGLVWRTIYGPSVGLSGEVGGFGPNQETLWTATGHVQIPF